MQVLWTIVVTLFLLSGCQSSQTVQEEMESMQDKEQLNLVKATFAGGCFWCSEADFEKVPDVIEVISGYAGGEKEYPRYEEVASGITEHVEAIQVSFDPTKTTYEQLLNYFWKHVDSTDSGGQFVDRGNQYRSVIFYHTEEQKKLAEQSREVLEKSDIFNKPIVTEIVKYTTFYPAEKYHQDYYKKNPLRYKYYRYNSGRDQFLEKVWGNEKDVVKPHDETTYRKPDDKTIKQTLTRMQYDVTQKERTEPPFENKYWNNKREGIYVDIVSGEPLFSSVDKFDSGTGWPSFSKPIDPEYIVTKEDRSLFFIRRTEVRSKYGDSHLGHVFNDGPLPTGLRYCINSTALRFIPRENMKKDGYEKYSNIFSEN